jgi:hypothetical protein
MDLQSCLLPDHLLEIDHLKIVTTYLSRSFLQPDSIMRLFTILLLLQEIIRHPKTKYLACLCKI